VTEPVVGTAGHVDHGKTALVLALTGVDCDRLAEERRRGMSIELGFASWQLPSGLEVSVVDVPGHERFVRTMAIGARSLDLALLCVAADDGVMPQTREHAAVLRLLGTAAVLLVTTKADLADEPRVAAVATAGRELLRTLGLDEVGHVAVSARTGAGLDLLRAAADAALVARPAREDRGVPRLFVDRTFTRAGVGTVVTGTLDGGALHPGELVEAWPSGARGRIHALQRRGRAVAAAEPGGRLAIAIRGLAVGDLPRGSTVGLAGAPTPSLALDVALAVPGTGASGLRQGVCVEVLHGTAAVPADVWLAGDDRLAPGGEGYAQLRLQRPLWALPGDWVLLRASAPAATLAGGRVLDAHPARHRRWTRAPLDPWSQRVRLLGQAGGAPALAVLEAAAAPGGLTATAAAARAGVGVPLARAALLDAVEQGELLAVGRRFVAPARWAVLDRRVRALLDRYHTAEPLGAGLPRRTLVGQLGIDPADAAAVLERLVAAGALELSDGVAVRPGWSAGSAESPAVRAVRQLLAAAGPHAPGAPELAAAGATPAVLAYLERRGDAVRLAPAVYLDAAGLAQAEATVRAALAAQREGLTASQLRERLGTSRRVIIPLLERLGRRGVTVRDGERHRLAAGPVEVR